uniref:Uncharacterized protein LOC111106987 n=1 Tax=Crassostrea virginica TaxID=6565 RepID=A0A8B8B2V5_CRAVI|nr:uncharacterized protein LOC111106987 [Crassostrea virginica]
MSFTINYLSWRQEVQKIRQHPSHMRTSTPAKPTLPRVSELTVSDIFSRGNGSTTETAESGVEELEKSVDIGLSLPKCSEPSTSQPMEFTSRAAEKKITLSSSFVDPFSLSISIKKTSEEDEDLLDEEYVPDYDVTLGSDEDADIEDVAGGDMVLESEETEVHVEDKPEEHYFGPGITQVLTTEGFGAVFRDEKVLAFEEQLLMLAKTKIDDKCLVKGCSEPVAISTKYVGTALYIIWSCSNSHTKHRWCSQPVLNKGLHSGDLVMSAAVLCSGNNFSKVKLMANMINLHLPSPSSYTRIQRTYLVPAIEEKWEEHLENVRSELADRELFC